MDPQLITKLQKNRDQAFKWQQRRHAQWTESYEMYRDKVQTNRLIQRQSVNLPLMKMTLRTLLAKFRRKMDLVFEDYGNDKDKEIFKNAYWEHCYRTAKLKSKDTANKKQVMLYGRTFWKLFVADGAFNAEVVDPFDVLIDRFADPSDIEGTANDVIHQHIYRTLKEVENDPSYNKGAIASLRAFYATPGGIKKASENAQSASDKAQRMEALGAEDIFNPQVGETVVEVNEHYVKLWDEKTKTFRFHLVTVADSQVLREKPLQEHLDPQNRTNGYWDTHIPIVTWGDDIERTDIWSDGIADIIRTINKVLNAWFSQMIENRTLRNFGMNFYDATANSEWSPQMMEPRPFGWYPLPGKPSEVFQKAEIPDLSESLDEMQFLITMAEQATAATATQKGTSEKSQITLGEVKMMMVEAEDRISDMQDPYEESWLELGEKWSNLIAGQADNLKPVRLYKKGYKGNYFDAEIKPSDLYSADGYGCKVQSASDKMADQVNSLQKLMAVKQSFPGNMAMKKITDRRLLEFIDLNPEEVREVEVEEEQLVKQQAMMAQVASQMGMAPGGPPQGTPQGMPAMPGMSPEPQLTQ